MAGYRVVERLGAGGMGEVLLVENTALDRLEAMKVISVAGSSNPDFHTRFVNEAKTTAALDHPSIVTIHQHGIDDGRPWFTMSYLKGRDLADDRPVDRGEILAIFAQVADALDYAHRNGVVHRDVKPANILVRRDESGRFERAVVVDFGIAKLTGSANLTATNAFVGTLKYTAPEVIEGKGATARSDQYSLACTLYEVFTGKPVFDDEAGSAILLAHVSKPANPISLFRPELRPLDPVFAKALAKDPADRYPDCRTFIRELGAAGSRSGVTAPPRGSGARPVPAPQQVPAPPTPRPTPTPAPNPAAGWTYPATQVAPGAPIALGAQWSPHAPAAPRSGGWKVLQSLWVLASLVSCGFLSWAGFLYCAIRINTRTWWLAFVGSVVFWIGVLVWIAGSGDETPSDASVLVFWLVPVAASLALLPKFLNDLDVKLRSKQ